VGDGFFELKRKRASLRLVTDLRKFGFRRLYLEGVEDGEGRGKAWPDEEAACGEKTFDGSDLCSGGDLWMCRTAVEDGQETALRRQAIRGIRGGIVDVLRFEVRLTTLSMEDRKFGDLQIS
jgi:hypothetical protein